MSVVFRKRDLRLRFYFFTFPTSKTPKLFTSIHNGFISIVSNQSRVRRGDETWKILSNLITGMMSYRITKIWSSLMQFGVCVCWVKSCKYNVLWNILASSCDFLVYVFCFILIKRSKCYIHLLILIRNFLELFIIPGTFLCNPLFTYKIFVTLPLH